MLRLDELTALNVRAVFATPIHGDIFVEYVRDLLRETPNQSLAAGGVSLFPARLLPPCPTVAAATAADEALPEVGEVSAVELRGQLPLRWSPRRFASASSRGSQTSSRTTACRRGRA